jgi:hypothetical protein
MAEAEHALGMISQQYGDRAFTAEPVEGGHVFVRADHVDVDASGCLLVYGHTPERDGSMLLAALGQGQSNSIWVCDPESNTPLALVDKTQGSQPGDRRFRNRPQAG